MITVEKGTELPPLTLRVTRADLVRYAGASGDFNPIHWSDRVAASVGLPGVIAHGMLTMALAGRLVTRWVDDPAAVRSYGPRCPPGRAGRRRGRPRGDHRHLRGARHRRDHRVLAVFAAGRHGRALPWPEAVQFWGLGDVRRSAAFGVRPRRLPLADGHAAAGPGPEGSNEVRCSSMGGRIKDPPDLRRAVRFRASPRSTMSPHGARHQDRGDPEVGTPPAAALVAAISTSSRRLQAGRASGALGVPYTDLLGTVPMHVPSGPGRSRSRGVAQLARRSPTGTGSSPSPLQPSGRRERGQMRCPSGELEEATDARRRDGRERPSNAAGCRRGRRPAPGGGAGPRVRAIGVRDARPGSRCPSGSSASAGGAAELRGHLAVAEAASHLHACRAGLRVVHGCAGCAAGLPRRPGRQRPVRRVTAHPRRQTRKRDAR